MIETADGAERYETRGGVAITRRRRETPYADAISDYIDALDSRRGAVFSSNYEYPGRYTRWDTAIVDPPLGVSARGRKLTIEAYNGRGEALAGDPQRQTGGQALILPFRADRTAQNRDRHRTSPDRSVFRGGALARANRVLGAAGDCRSVSFGRGRQYRFLRRIRLRSCVSVRFRFRLKIDRPDDQRDLMLYSAG
jgi:anthranilate synthase